MRAPHGTHRSSPDRSKVIKKTAKILTIVAVTLTFLLATPVILLNNNKIQNYVVSRLTEWLSGELGTRIGIGHVNIRLPNRLGLERLYIEDLNGDTLYPHYDITGRLDAFGRKDVKVLDLCTGSGCIAWTLALSCPGCRVMGVDISEGALRTADGQDFGGEIKRTGALKPVFIREDVLALAEDGPLPDAVAGWGGFDILVSNPPYVRDSERAMMRRNVCDFEPGLALFVPDEDPLKFYRSIAVWAKLALVDGGAGFVEINEAFGEQTAALFRGAGFRNVGAVKDFCGKNRFVRFTK